jgi:hypothetical protein
VALTATERRLRAQIATHTGWSRTVDRTARTQHGRNAMSLKLEAEVIASIGESTWRALTPVVREKLIASKRSAYSSGLALASAKARRRRAEGK